MRRAVIATAFSAAILMSGCAQASSTVALQATPAASSAVTASIASARATTATDPAPSPPAPSAAAASAGQPADLVETLAQLPLPTGSVRLTKAGIANQATVGVSNAATKKSVVGYWRSPLSRDATLTWLAQHLAPTWKGGGLGSSNDVQMVEYDRQPTPSLEGPNLTISVAPDGTGASVIVTAWEIPVAAKSNYETLAGVTGATVSTKDEVAPLTVPPLQSVTLDAAQAEKLAAAFNALPVDDGSPHGCTAGTPDVVLDFSTTAGHRTFLYSRDCHDVTTIPDGNGPTLAGGPYAEVEALLKTVTGPVRGTLIVNLASSTHTNHQLPGRITIRRAGAVVDSADVATDRFHLTTELPGTYEITAISAGHTCKPDTATVVANQQVDVTLICTPAP